jgi:hypothetical protein
MVIQSASSEAYAVTAEGAIYLAFEHGWCHVHAATLWRSQGAKSVALRPPGLATDEC